MATASKGLHKLLEDQHADIYYAGKQIPTALPKMIKSGECRCGRG